MAVSYLHDTWLITTATTINSRCIHMPLLHAQGESGVFEHWTSSNIIIHSHDHRYLSFPLADSIVVVHFYNLSEIQFTIKL